MLRMSSTILIVCIIACLVMPIISVTAAAPSFAGTLFITTYDLDHDNNSLIAMDPNTGAWKSVSGYARSIDATDYAYDVDKSLYYIVAGGDIPHVDFVNATDGSIIGGVQLLVPSFMNGQFESPTNSLVGIVMTDTQIFVQRVSLATGVATNIASLNTQWIEILQDSSAMDPANRLYYCTIGDGSDSMSLLIVNLITGTYNTTRIAQMELSPAAYNKALGCFIGYQGPQAVCIDNHGNMKTIISQVNGIVLDGGWSLTSEGGQAGSLFVATVNLGPYYLMTYDIASGAELNRFDLPCGVHFLAYFPRLPYRAIA